MMPGRGGEVVVITGASAGVGRAAALAFARTGARLALLARGAAGLAGAAREAEAAGAGAVIALPTDVADHRQVEAAAAQAEAALGPIDVWVNDAMATLFSPVHAITPEEYRRATEVTYLGGVYGAMAALRRMRPRNRGTIVTVGSALAYRAIPLQAPYCGAKFALRGFIESLRCELLHERSGIHVTMVHLSAFNTPQFAWSRTHIDEEPQPLPPVYDPDIAARAIVWASRHRRREVWVGFPAVKTILAARLAPWLLDRYLARKGWSGQLSGRPLAPDRPDNLFAPAAGDFGVRGTFRGRIRRRSPQLWLATHRGSAVALLAAALAIVAALLIQSTG
jgi:NAD(P)-dependent dehydrogenase (short-subunit alcohol dehydrogenase family)